MIFCMQPPIRHSFSLANFQLCCKGRRLKGCKVKRPKFQKLSDAILIKCTAFHNGFTCIFKLKRPISRNFALELRVPYRLWGFVGIISKIQFLWQPYILVTILHFEKNYAPCPSEVIVDFRSYQQLPHIGFGTLEGHRVG